MSEIPEDKMLEQVGKQCRAVSHLARALADVFEDQAKLIEAKIPAMADIVDTVGERSARIMEDLGDTLNGMDAVSEDDEWLTPIFEEAHRLFPGLPE